MISSEILEAEEISHLPERGFQACEVTAVPWPRVEAGGLGGRWAGTCHSLVGGYDPDTPTPTPTRHDAGSRNALPALSSAPRGAETRQFKSINSLVNSIESIAASAQGHPGWGRSPPQSQPANAQASY